MPAEHLTETTLCILVKGKPVSRVLLGYKKIGFGRGKYTGFGGKVEPGETALEAAVRELGEETGLRVSEREVSYVGRLKFLFPHKPAWNQHVHVFLAETWEGEPVESNEMAPAWFNLDQIPYAQMWQDGEFWLPPILSGKSILAEFIFEADNESIGELNIQLQESELGVWI